jgi:hypothetical protein
MSWSLQHSFRDQESRKQTLIWVVVLTIWLVSLIRAVYVFSPDSDHVYFNSDGAIPVLMSNDPRLITVFDTYYYATDRWGGWPMMLARRFHQTTGFYWTSYRLNAIRVLWLFAGLWVLVCMNRRLAIPIMLIGVAAICLHPIIRLRLFDLGQVYAWQITPLLLSWLGLRKWFEQTTNSATLFGPARKHLGWALFVLFFAFLAIWSSPASWPPLFFLVFLEAFRSRLASKTIEPASRSWRRLFAGLSLVILPTLGELLLRINYHRHALKHFHEDYKTDLKVDFGHLTDNFIAQKIQFFGFSWWPIIILALMAALVLVGVYGYAVLNRKSELLASARTLLRDDAWFAVICLIGTGVINFALTTSVNHVRVNLYDNRFLTLTFLFGSISGLLTIFLTVRWLFERIQIPKLAGVGLIAAAILFVMIAFPEKRDGAIYKVTQETASVLMQRAPNAALMGGYWQTYVFSALQSEGKMLMPLPFEGQQVRMPWTKQKLSELKQVVVEYGQSKLVEAGQPPPDNLVQYGNTLKLVERDWYQNGEFRFALYENESKRN